MTKEDFYAKVSEQAKKYNIEFDPSKFILS